MNRTMIDIIILILLCIVILGFLFTLLNWRKIIKKMTKKYGSIIMSDKYQENLIEMLAGFKHMGIQTTFENNLRSEFGKILHRPLGSTRQWPHFESITFIPAQAAKFPTDHDVAVDISVTIGPKAKKPLEINAPFMISGMAYGIALAKNVRLALMDAANNVGIAINSGEGGILDEEIDSADKYILQFGKARWSKDEKLLKKADMIEIKFGQGALLGMGDVIIPRDLQGHARKVMGLEDDEDAVIHNNFFENQTMKDLKDLVQELRRISGGVPIGAKVGAGGKIEDDIDTLLELDVDFIAIDGGQAATYGAAPILTDDFGIPTLHALIRAVNHLEKLNKKSEISLIISGGMFTPGEYLKAIALGADAVYLGSVLLFTVAHKQVLDAVPFEPPTQVVWSDGKYKDKFVREEGAKNATNYLKSTIEELEVAIRAMGKKKLSDVTKEDLVSYEKNTAEAAGVPFTTLPYSEGKVSHSSLKKEKKKDPLIEL